MENKDILSDKRLSLGAMGLYWYLSEKKADGNFSQNDLLNIFNNGTTEIRKYLDELLNFKYLTREQIRKDGRICGIRYNFNSIDVLKENSTLQEKDDHRIGYLYLVTDGNLYKIGVTKTPKSRFNQLKNNCTNFKIIEYGQVNGYLRKESYLHSLFKAKNEFGEWYNFEEKDIKFVENYIKENKIKI